MPYEISFKKPVQVADPEIYINDCCWGGDVVQTRLLPLVEADYTDVMADQEDWGWFIWFKKDDINLAIDICSDSKEGDFRIHLSAARVRWFGLSRRAAEDTPEVEALLDKVKQLLSEWAGNIAIVRTDRDFMEIV